MPTKSKKRIDMSAIDAISVHFKHFAAILNKWHHYFGVSQFYHITWDGHSPPTRFTQHI
ncbi:hypothetical protein MBGDF03_01041 [Thermoplasmatales archaeon SCGC AB-540-F20]|nr:hypothetical protein MBGDF03_01041 [Thermoplasmatales archaeon SCGC AB-540-F20]